MLRYKDKEDIEARYAEVDATVALWRETVAQVPNTLRDEFHKRLQISLIYHDAALEGEVLTHSEIKAAIDPTIISDTSLIPSYEKIKNFDAACQFAFEYAKGRKKAITLDTLREICGHLDPGDGSKACPYRKDNPLHRLYYHDIAPPEKISYRMRKFAEFLDSNDSKHRHPVEHVAMMHHQLMHIFPWAKRTGKTARIASNMMLLQADFPLAVIHSIDRQKYYEALRGEVTMLVSVYLEAIETAAASELQVYAEAARGRRRRRA